MKANIVIFGKNSIIAQNFINKTYSIESNFITVSRTPNSKDDTVSQYVDYNTPLVHHTFYPLDL